MTTRVLRELERPRRFHRASRMERPEPTTPDDPGGTPAAGDKPRTHDGIAQVKQFERVEMGGRESEHPIVR